MNRDEAQRALRLAIGRAKRVATGTDADLNVVIITLEAAEALADEQKKTPRVEIDSALGAPTTCKVWIDGRLVFDGLDRGSATLRDEQIPPPMWENRDAPLRAGDQAADGSDASHAHTKWSQMRLRLHQDCLPDKCLVRDGMCPYETGEWG